VRKFTKDEAKAIAEKAIKEYEALTSSEACNVGQRLSTKAMFKALGVEAPAPKKIGLVEFCVKYDVKDENGGITTHYSPTSAKAAMEDANCFYVEGQYAWNDLDPSDQEGYFETIMEKLKETAAQYVVNDMKLKIESEV